MKRLLCEEKVEIPEGCSVEILERVMTVRGKRATAVRDLSHFVLTMDVHEGHVRLRYGMAQQGAQQADYVCICDQNCIVGCMSGYEYTLRLCTSTFNERSDRDDGKTVVVKNFLDRSMLGDTKCAETLLRGSAPRKTRLLWRAPRWRMCLSLRERFRKTVR
uniref:Large subunit ribosomal protein L9e n=1 Tax=Antonospora locustae TaxID=278021 RepID=Q6E6D2_ANTLO|nr:large subunit ribosomal protein L9e [Antonospora locustae]